MRTLFLLMAGHYISDFALQNDWMAANKGQGPVWLHVLFAHCMIQALPVYLVTNSMTLALLELVLHGLTDWAKCRGYIGFHTDQAIHIACKLMWTYLSSLGI